MCARACVTRRRLKESSLAVGRVPQYKLIQAFIERVLLPKADAPAGAATARTSALARKGEREQPARGRGKKRSRGSLLDDSDEDSDGLKPKCREADEEPIGRRVPKLAYAAVAVLQQLHATFPPVVCLGAAADGATGAPGAGGNPTEVLGVCQQAWLPLPQMPGNTDFQVFDRLAHRVRKAVKPDGGAEPELLSSATLADVLLFAHACNVLADDAEVRLRAWEALPRVVLLQDSCVYRLARAAPFREDKSRLLGVAVLIAASGLAPEHAGTPAVAAAARLVCAWRALAARLSGADTDGLAGASLVPQRAGSSHHALDIESVASKVFSEYKTLEVASKLSLLRALPDPACRCWLVRQALVTHAFGANGWMRVEGLTRLSADSAACGAGAMLEYVAAEPKKVLRDVHTRNNSQAEREEELMGLVAVLAGSVAQMLREGRGGSCARPALLDAARAQAPRAAEAVRREVEAHGGEAMYAGLDAAMATSARAAALAC